MACQGKCYILQTCHRDFERDPAKRFGVLRFHLVLHSVKVRQAQDDRLFFVLFLSLETGRRPPQGIKKESKVGCTLIGYNCRCATATRIPNIF